MHVAGMGAAAKGVWVLCVLAGSTSASTLPWQHWEWSIEIATYMSFFMQKLITSDLEGKRIRTSVSAKETARV